MIRDTVDVIADPLIISSNSLISGMVYIKELDITAPMYHQWPTDLETK